MVIACIELCCWILICNLMMIIVVLACMKDVCFFVMIIWWMIGDKHVYVLLFVEHIKCWLLVLNSYMLIFMVILLVNACMQNEGDIRYYIQWWWVIVEHIHSVRMFMHHKSWIFISSWGDLPAHQIKLFETWSDHQWSYAWFGYCPMKDQFQIHSKSGGTPLQAQLLFLY